MANERRRGEWRWILTGAVVLALTGLVLYHFQTRDSRVARLAEQHRRLDLVERMARDLARASEAEKNAVMADTDEQSQAFAAAARAGAADVAQERDELARLLPASGGGDERELLGRFSATLADYERLDRELLDLAVRNTNLKAYDLAFGPAREAVHDLDGALTRLLSAMAGSKSPHAPRIMLLAAAVQSGVLRNQALLPEHIAEDDTVRMDELESGLAAEDRRLRANLEHLQVLVPPAGRADLATAAAACERFAALTAQIVELSRQNTNVRSLALSLNQKRLATVRCQEALAALEQAIRGEPVPGLPARPR